MRRRVDYPRMELTSLPLIRVFKRNGPLIKLAFPVFLELILSVAMGYVNQFLLAGIPLASNGVSQSNQISNIFVVSFSVLSSSSLILLSQLLGKNEKEAVGKIYSLSFFINLVLGMLVAGILVGFSFFVFPLMGVDEAVIPYAKLYTIVSAPGVIFLALNNVFSSFLRANKQMAFPTVIAFLTNVINAAVAAIFIWAIPGLSELDKLIGVAVASDLSRLVGLVASYFFFRFGIGGRLSLKCLRPFPSHLFKKLLAIGLPTAGETLSYNASQLVLSVIVNLSVSVLEQNLRNYLMTFTSLIYLFASGSGIAMQVSEGLLLGAGDKEEANRLVLDVGTMARTVSFLMSLLFTGLAYPVFLALMAPAVSDPAVNVGGLSIETVALMAVYLMLIDIVLDQGRASNLVYVKALETSGDISFPVLCSIFTSWLFTVGASALLSIVFGLGVYGAFIGATLDECVRAVLFYVRWKRGGWKKRNLTSGID